jgi:predicted DNA-binding transcriptional regulator AlpA
MDAGKSGFTVAELNDLPPSLGLEAAALMLGIGRTNAYALVQRGAFPVPVLRIGRRYRVSTHAVLHLLGVEPTAIRSPRSPDR